MDTESTPPPTPGFAPHPAMSPHGLLTPADGFQSLIGAISAQSAVSLGIQVLGFLSQRPNFFPGNKAAAWVRFCAAAADLLATDDTAAPADAAPIRARDVPT